MNDDTYNLAAPEWEDHLLGGLLNDTAAIWRTQAARLKIELMAGEANREIMGCIMEVFTEGKEVNTLTITARLRANAMLDKVGGPARLTELGMIRTIGTTINEALGELENMRARRDMVRFGAVMQLGAKDTTRPWKEVLEEVEAGLFDLHRVTSKKGTVHVSAVLPKVCDEIQQAFANRGHVVAGLATGFTDLDRTLMGLKTGLCILAARPSRGKTVLGAQLALNLAGGLGHYHEFNQAPLPVAFYSLETTDVALVRRMTLNQWGVPIQNARSGLMSRAQKDDLAKSVQNIAGMKLYLHESFGMTIQELRAQVRLDTARYGLKAIIVDYLQLLSSSSKKAALSRSVEIGEISTGLKHLAHELDMPVITLAQLNRDGDVRRPGLKDLRESGQIEQDADYVIMICDVPEEWETDEDGVPLDHAWMGLDVVKNKDGPTTTDAVPIGLRWDKSIFKLRSDNDSLLSNNREHQQRGMGKAPAAKPGKESKGRAGSGESASMEEIFE